MVSPPAETFGGIALPSFGMKVLASWEARSGVGAFFLSTPCLSGRQLNVTEILWIELLNLNSNKNV